VAHIYHSAFSRLARTYAVTVVAGSIVLPAPQVREGEVVAGDGPLRSVSAIYRPDGQAHARLVCKAFPTTVELPFVTPARPAAWPSFETPAGRLGVLICADSWYPEPYTFLKSQEVELLAVPSYLTERGIWDRPWRGYDGGAMPEDVDPGDAGRLTEGQAWRKYALAGRMAQAGARAGLNVFLSGSLWDLGAEGASMMAAAGTTPVEAQGGRAALLNLWL
jgi:hypothetical protein